MTSELAKLAAFRQAIDPCNRLGRAGRLLEDLDCGIQDCGRIQADGIGRSLMAALEMIPVSNMPPAVQPNKSLFSCAEQRRICTVPSHDIPQSRQLRKLPSLWWFLPCTSAAIAPRRVTNLLPGTTSGNQPRSRKAEMTSPSNTPLSATNAKS
ncbi:hypothetical protein [Leisingera methylohalidivorans]|uniref:hypothetical protein n=1 Tax=Leisingera methylohalidivorans TaxID=133924 RepID=UPI0012EBE5A8|nr:hypothetical protein [Leisingera methylohalidivorans]